MNKKIMTIVIGILILAIIGASIILAITKNKQTSEIQPQEEISDEQMRQTIVTLYYQNKETKALMPEGRMIDAKTLLTDPYATLVNLLIEQPKNEKLQSAIPQGTRVLKSELKGDMVYIDLSKEFIDNHVGNEEAQRATIYAIVNTLTELNEVNSVKILINGKENEQFKDGKVNFKEAFVRIKNEEENKKTNTQNTNSINNNTTTPSNNTTNTNKVN